MARIFVVDDDRSIRELLQIALELEGYEVTVFGNGRQMLESLEAIQRAQSDATPAGWRCLPEPPGVILMDLMMPVMDGWAACQYLEAHSELLAHSRLIAMSAAAEAGDAIPPQAQMLLCKPFHLDHLLELVASQMEALTVSPEPERLPVSSLAMLRAG
ncbi:MAG TPA: response regulator [Ktedonobacterales bacterium]|nr:response regulator [Ktedonobacterales bacterium]